MPPSRRLFEQFNVWWLLAASAGVTPFSARHRAWNVMCAWARRGQGA